MKHQSIYNRLRRIEGQIRGIEQMVSSDKPEDEILIQLRAANSSLASATNELIKSTLAKDTNGAVSLSKETVDLILNLLK